MKLSAAIRRWWRRVRLGLRPIEMVLLERLVANDSDWSPRVIRSSLDVAVVVGLKRLEDRGFADCVGKDGDAYIYVPTPAGRIALSEST